MSKLYFSCIFILLSFQVIADDYKITKNCTLTFNNDFMIADLDKIGRKFFNIRYKDRITHAVTIVYGEYNQQDASSYTERIRNLISEEKLKIAAMEHLANFYPEYKNSLQGISVEPLSTGPTDKWIYLYLDDEILVLYASRQFTTTYNNIECFLFSVDIDLNLSAQRNLIGDLLLSIVFNFSPEKKEDTSVSSE